MWQGSFSARMKGNVSCAGELGQSDTLLEVSPFPSRSPLRCVWGGVCIRWWHRRGFTGGRSFPRVSEGAEQESAGGRGSAGGAALSGQVEVIALLVVVQHLLPEARGVHPGDEVLHGPGDEESGVGHHLGPHTDVPLLHEGDGVAQALGHPQLHQQAGQAPAAEGGGREALADGQRPPAAHQPQPVELLQQRGGAAGAEGGAGRPQVAEAAGQGADGAGQRLVLHVVLPPTQPVTAQRLHLGQAPPRRLPAHQLQPPQQLLLVVLQLPHHLAAAPGSPPPPRPARSGEEPPPSAPPLPRPGRPAPARRPGPAGRQGPERSRRASPAVLGWPRVSSPLRRGCCRGDATWRIKASPAGGAGGRGRCSGLPPSLGCGWPPGRAWLRAVTPGTGRGRSDLPNNLSCAASPPFSLQGSHPGFVIPLGKTGLSVKAPMEMGSSSTEKFYRIPKGKGPHSVGCTDLMTENAVEGSFLRLYYPSCDATDNEEAPWIPDKEYYQGLSDFLNMYRVVGERLFQYYVGSVTCPAKSNAAFKMGEKYPLLVFSHGLGAFRTIYSAICIEMASQGFIVAAVEHRDESASATYYCKKKSVSEPQEESTSNTEKEWIYYRKLKTGEEERCLRHKQVQQRAQECIKALNLILKINSGEEVMNVLNSNFDWNSLKDSVDTSRIAVMGHSFGGATVIESLSKEIRFRCGIALDAWMLPIGDDIYQNSVQQPLLFINSEKFQWAENILKMKRLSSNDTNKKMITIKGSVHQSFPDFTFVSGEIIGRFFKLKGEIDPNEAIDISNHASLAFLQKHLSLKKDFDKWDSLVDGIGPNVIPGTNIDLSPAEPE